MRLQGTQNKVGGDDPMALQMKLDKFSIQAKKVQKQ